MLLSLPPEILDIIVDHLRDEPTALRACSLVSKSWVPRTQRHLFDCVKFLFKSGPTIESWMETFPDPSNSPAHYTRSLRISHIQVITVAISDVLAQIHSFNRIVELAVAIENGPISFAQLRGLSPNLKRLYLFHSFAPSSEVFDFICSFPLLENLSLHSARPHANENAAKWNKPSTSPKFTGSLLLSGSNRIITRKLLDLPGGLHFSKIRARCPIEECNLTQELVSACSDTLESLCVQVYRGVLEPGMPPLLDLSNATSLKDVEFRLREPYVSWVNATLQTARSRNLRQIIIHIPATFRRPVDETARLEWQDLDRLLVRLWTTCSIRPVFTYEMKGEGTDPEAQVPELLPELMSRGVIDVV